MTFWDHLDELRESLVRCLYLFFVGFIGFYFVSEKILDFLRYPLFSQLPIEKQHLYYTGLFENFLVHLKVSAYASIIVLSPAYFMILWKFIGPGLYEEEKRHVRPFVLAAAVFFLGGSAFAYFVLLPIGIRYFLSYGTSAEVAFLTLENYVTLILRILIGFGLCFEIPVFIVLLAKIGLVRPETLAQHRRTAIVAITAISALIAPPDAISMLLLMAPLYLLFEGSILVAKRIVRAKDSTPHATAPGTSNTN